MKAEPKDAAVILSLFELGEAAKDFHRARVRFEAARNANERALAAAHDRPAVEMEIEASWVERVRRIGDSSEVVTFAKQI